jgi:AAA domain
VASFEIATVTTELKPDKEALRNFVYTMFRHAGNEGYASLRSFVEGDTKSFRITPVGLGGGPGFLWEAAADDAYRAANATERIVFCPPLAIFLHPDNAKQSNLLAGLALSVECDEHARNAVATLEQLLGPATAIVRSGGCWTDPETGQAEDKLHIHFRIIGSARGPEALTKLKRARELATAIVGGDPSNVPIVHCIRWPGSFHRKGAPKPCAFKTLNPDAEIDLDAALATLEAAAPEIKAKKKANGKSCNDYAHGGDWAALIQGVLTAESFHEPLSRLAMRLLKSGMSSGSACNMLRGLMENAAGERNERWRVRYADIGRAVDSAREKLEPPAGGQTADQDNDLLTTKAGGLEMSGVNWLWPGRFARGKFGLIAGLPDMGKGQIAAFIAAAVTANVDLPCDEGNATQGNVIWFNAEDGACDTVLPRLVAAGADSDRVHFVNSVLIAGEEKHFSLVTDLHLLRKAIIRIGNVTLAIIDPVSAYLGVGKVDSRSATDVRGTLTPLKAMAEELHVAVIGIAHFNKKDDIKSALLRVSDSIAWVAAARHVYAVVDDPDDKNSKLFVKAKNNLAPDRKALRYGMSVKTVGRDAKLGVDINAPYIVWHGQHVEITANEAMQGAGGHTAKREAREFLLDRLKAGPVKADDIIDEAKQEGIAKRTLDRAKKELSIKSRKTPSKFDGAWFWELPPRAKPCT